MSIPYSPYRYCTWVHLYSNSYSSYFHNQKVTWVKKCVVSQHALATLSLLQYYDRMWYHAQQNALIKAPLPGGAIINRSNRWKWKWHVPFLLSDSLFCSLKIPLGRKELTVVLSVVLPMVSIITFLGIVGVVVVLVTRSRRGRLVDWCFSQQKLLLP